MKRKQQEAEITSVQDLPQSSVAHVEKRDERDTVNGEEILKLVKDAHDIIDLFKHISANKEAIKKRFNIVHLTFNVLFTVLFCGYKLFNRLSRSISLSVTFYVMIGVFGLLVVGMGFSLLADRSTKSTQYSSVLIKWFRLGIKLITTAIMVYSIVTHFANGNGELTSNVLDTLIFIMMVFATIVNILVYMGGGIVQLVKWLLSPAKITHSFGKVLLEWYQHINTNKKDGYFVRKQSYRFTENISRVIDTYILPIWGKKKITDINSATLSAIVVATPDEDKMLVEGTLKKVFEFALDRGYVAVDPCLGIKMEGSIDNEIENNIRKDKPVKDSLATRLLNRFLIKK